jgi:uncharacterized protein with PIN domain
MMELAKQKRNCPHCREPLTGLIREIEMCGGYPRFWNQPKQTDWLCENCDQVFVQVRGFGMITEQEWKKLYGEDSFDPQDIGAEEFS